VQCNADSGSRRSTSIRCTASATARSWWHIWARVSNFSHDCADAFLFAPPVVVPRQAWAEHRHRRSHEPACLSMPFSHAKERSGDNITAHFQGRLARCAKVVLRIRAHLVMAPAALDGRLVPPLKSATPCCCVSVMIRGCFRGARVQGYNISSASRPAVSARWWPEASLCQQPRRPERRKTQNSVLLRPFLPSRGGRGQGEPAGAPLWLADRSWADVHVSWLQFGHRMAQWRQSWGANGTSLDEHLWHVHSGGWSCAVGLRGHLVRRWGLPGHSLLLRSTYGAEHPSVGEHQGAATIAPVRHKRPQEDPKSQTLLHTFLYM